MLVARGPVFSFLAPFVVAAAVGAQGGDAADAQPLRSGPAVGAALSPLSVYAPSGPHAGKTYDAVARYDEGPGLVLFVHELTRNVAPIVRAVDGLADRFGVRGLRTVTVLLGDDRNAIENAARRASQSLRMGLPLVVSTDGAEGPGAWALSRRAAVTLVLSKNGEVARSIAWTDTNAADARKLEAWVTELCGGAVPDDGAQRRELARSTLPSDPEELAELAAELRLRLLQRASYPARQARGRRQPARGNGERMQRGNAGEPDRERATGKAPDDPRLRELLREIIARDADAAALAASFAAVDEHVGDDAGRKAQVRSMFELVQRLGYGTDEARERAQAWLDDPANAAPAKRSAGGAGRGRNAGGDGTKRRGDR